MVELGDYYLAWQLKQSVGFWKVNAVHGLEAEDRYEPQLLHVTDKAALLQCKPVQAHDLLKLLEAKGADAKEVCWCNAP
jgi:hypothetical protein